MVNSLAKSTQYARVILRFVVMCMSENIKGIMPQADKILQTLLVLFDRYVLKEKDGKIIVLLIGGDKSSQQKDIEKAKDIWNKIKK